MSKQNHTEQHSISISINDTYKFHSAEEHSTQMSNVI